MDIGKMVYARKTISRHLLISMNDSERSKLFAQTIHELMGVVSENITNEIIAASSITNMKMDIRYSVRVKESSPLDLDVELSAQLREISTMPMPRLPEPREGIEEFFKKHPFEIDSHGPTFISASYTPSPFKLPKDPEEATDPKGVKMSMEEFLKLPNPFEHPTEHVDPAGSTAMTEEMIRRIEALKAVSGDPFLNRMIRVDMDHVDKIEGPEEPKGETDDNHKLMWRGKEIK